MATFETLIYYFQTYGVLDFLLPFLLVFTLIFAVTQRLPLFKDNKNFRIIISLVLGLLFVVPHITGTYPLGYDPVQVMNNSLPSISLIAVAAVMLLLLMGIFGTDFSTAAAPWIALVSIIFVVYVFGAALKIWNGPWDIFSWWSSETTELMIIILTFGLVVYFITKEPKKPGDKTMLGDLIKGFEKMVEKK
jgi:hypothetical protein